MITPSPFLKYVQATDDEEGGGENHGGEMETGDGGHGGDEGIAIGDGGHGGDVIEDEGHGSKDGGATGLEGGDVGLGIEDNNEGIGGGSDGGMETGDGDHGGKDGGTTGLEGGDVGLGIQENEASVDQDSSIHDIDMDNNVNFGDDIAIVDQDNIAQCESINTGDMCGDEGLGTEDKAALEKKFEELWGTK